MAVLPASAGQRTVVRCTPCTRHGAAQPTPAGASRRFADWWAGGRARRDAPSGTGIGDRCLRRRKHPFGLAIARTHAVIRSSQLTEARE
jgi:hypothetical protein